MADNQRLLAATSQQWSSKHILAALIPCFKTCSSSSSFAQNQKASPRLAASKSLWDAPVLRYPGQVGCAETDLLVVLGSRHHREPQGVSTCRAALHWLPTRSGEQLSPLFTAHFSKALRVRLSCRLFAKGMIPHLTALQWFGQQRANLSVFHHARHFCFSSLPAIQFLMKNSCSCSVISHYIKPGQLQTVHVS